MNRTSAARTIRMSFPMPSRYAVSGPVGTQRPEGFSGLMPAGPAAGHSWQRSVSF
jgi:hypothetical protein